MAIGMHEDAVLARLDDLGNPGDPRTAVPRPRDYPDAGSDEVGRQVLAGGFEQGGAPGFLVRKLPGHPARKDGFRGPGNDGRGVLVRGRRSDGCCRESGVGCCWGSGWRSPKLSEEGPVVFSDALFEDPVETLPEVAVAVGVGVREQGFTHLDSPVVVHLAQVFGGLPDLGVGVVFLLLRALGIGFELREVLQELVGIDGVEVDI